jgi:hypothetical protein
VDHFWVEINSQVQQAPSQRHLQPHNPQQIHPAAGISQKMK